MEDKDTKKTESRSSSESSLFGEFLLKDESDQEVVDTGFIKETIKARPIGKRRWVKRTLSTALMAVLFGVIASLIFMMLEPLLARRLFGHSETLAPQLDATQLTLEEINPEDMVGSDAALAKEAAEATVAAFQADNTQLEKDIRQIISSQTGDLATYRSYYTQLRKCAQQRLSSIVLVEVRDTESSLFPDSFEAIASTSGVIIEETDASYTILVSSSLLARAKTIRVSFNEGIYTYGTIIGELQNIPFALISTEKAGIPPTFLDEIAAAPLGSSNIATLQGSPVIALGSPTGRNDSMIFGMVTDLSAPDNIPDRCYQIIGTDMYGSPDASGILLSLSGQVIGILTSEYALPGMENRVEAIGISGIRPAIIKILRGGHEGYLGIIGSAVPEKLSETGQVPNGIYVERVEYSSPAMSAGLRSGDIISEVKGLSHLTEAAFCNYIVMSDPGDELVMTVMRSGSEGYYPVTVTCMVR